MKHDKHLPNQFEQKVERRESKFRNFLRNMKNTALNNMSKGAANIARAFNTHGDNCRRREGKK